jgi:signal transduction histidine kinase
MARTENGGGRVDGSSVAAAARSEEGHELIVRVRDTGPGISPEFLLYVFDVFTQADHTLDRSQGGLGLGLTLVKQLVELHGGEVAESYRPSREAAPS